MRIELISLVWKTSIITIILHLRYLERLRNFAIPSTAWQAVVLTFELQSHWRTVQESNLSTWFCRPIHKRSVNGPYGGNNLNRTSDFILMRDAFYRLNYVAVHVIGLEPTTYGLKGRYSTC